LSRCARAAFGVSCSSAPAAAPPPTHPRPNPLPVTAFLRRFKPGNAPGRHRAKPSPAGFCSPQKTELVSFSLCEPPARGRRRRISAAKSLSDKPLRGAAQPGKSLIRMTLLVTRAGRAIQLDIRHGMGWSVLQVVGIGPEVFGLSLDLLSIGSRPVVSLLPERH